MRRVAIIGAGIAGLAHAWSAAERGHEVTVLERSARAEGATIRNFGMLWPIGQPDGFRRELALSSRARWDELSTRSGVWLEACGSIHVAHREDERRVLEEFAAWGEGRGVACQMLSASEVLARTPAVRGEGLLGGLVSPTEARVNPRLAAGQIAGWLAREFGVRFEFGTTIVRAEAGGVVASDGRSWAVDRVIVCSGADAGTLFPGLLGGAGMRLCKLQMMRTGAQPGGWRMGPHVASGLTLRHYANFEVCAGLAGLRERVARETPELDRLGIHVMASQNQDGSVLLGDSHEYDADMPAFESDEIDRLMLRELRRVFDLADWEIAERWTGVYLKHPERAFFASEPEPGVHVCTGFGGGGMTMSMGVAEHLWGRWEG